MHQEITADLRLVSSFVIRNAEFTVDTVGLLSFGPNFMYVRGWRRSQWSWI